MNEPVTPSGLESSEPEGDPPLDKSRPRKRSRLGRVLTWLVRGVFLIIVLLGLLAWWGVRRATDITLWGLERASLDKQVQLSKVEIGWDRIQVKDVKLLVGQAPASKLEMTSLELEYDPLRLGHRELQKLTVHEPRLSVTGKLAELAPVAAHPRVPGAIAPSPPASRGGFLQWLAEGWQLHEVAMDPLAVRIGLEGYPAMEASVSMQTGLLELDNKTLTSSDLRELRIERLRVARASDQFDASFLGWEKFRALFSLQEIRNGHVHLLEMEQPSLSITPQSLPFLQLLRRLEEQQGGRDAASAPDVARSKSGKIIPRVDHMKLTGGSFYLGGFPRELEVPETTFRYSIQTPNPPGEGKPGEHMHEFRLEDFRIGPIPGSGPQLLRIPLIRIQTTLAQLATQRVRLLEFNQPKVRIDPAFLSTPGKYARILGFRPSEPGPPPPPDNAPAAHPPGARNTALVPAPIEAPKQPWVAEEARMADAAFELADLGTRVPNMRFTATLDTKDLAWPPSGELKDRVHTVQARDFTAAAPFAQNQPFVSILKLDFDVTVAQLAARQIGEAHVEGLDFEFDRTFRSFVSAEVTPDPTPGAAPPKPKSEPAPPTTDGEEPPPEPGWTVKSLTINHALIALRDLSLGIPDHEFELQPVLLKEVNFNADSALLPPIPQRIELADFAIRSPYNPLVKVLTVNNIFCEFTFPGLLRHQIDKLTILGPTVRIGEDLFWYLDRFKQPEAQPAPTSLPEAEPVAAEYGPPTPGWVIKDFDLTYGRLIYAPTGAKELRLPWTYRTETKNLRFSNLSELQASLSLVMRPENFEFPDLKLSVVELGGNIEFNLPLGANVKNVVNVLKAKQIRIQKYELDDLWAALTFDEKGAYLKLGGQAYGNELTGELNFLPFNGMQWDGWLASGEMDLASLNQVLGGELFSMEGRSTLKLIANGREKDVTRVTGTFQALKPGEFHLQWADKMIENIPPEFDKIRRALLKIALETFRDYRYDAGRADLEYVKGAGALKMNFTGPDGARNVELNLHPPPPATPDVSSARP